MDPGLRVTSKECLSFKSNKKVFISSKKDAAGRSGGKAGLPPNMKFNKQKGYNDPAEMFPGKSEKIFKGLFCIWKYRVSQKKRPHVLNGHNSHKNGTGNKSRVSFGICM